MVSFGRSILRCGGFFLSRFLKYKELAEQVIHDDDNYLGYGGDAEFVEALGRADEGAEQPADRVIVAQALQVQEADEEVFVELDEDERHQEVEDEHGASAEGKLDHLDEDRFEAFFFALEDPVFVDEERERYGDDLRHERTEDGVVREDVRRKPGDVIDDGGEHAGDYVDDYLAVFGEKFSHKLPPRDRKSVV